MAFKTKHLKDPDFSSKYDFDLRKCIHVRLYTGTKCELDIMKHRMDLTLQDIFECLAQEVIDENPHIIKILNQYRIKKQNKEIEKYLSDSDAETLFKAIAENDPLLEDNDDEME